MLSGTVVDIRNLPQEITADVNVANSEELASWFIQWIGYFFQSVQIIVDRGSENSIKVGDYFAVIYAEETVRNLAGKELGTLRRDGSIIRVIQAFPQFSICQLQSYHYVEHMNSLSEFFKSIEKDVAKGMDTENIRARLEKRLNTIGPVMVGQKVVRIQPDEKTGRDLLEDLYGKVIKPEIDDEEKIFYTHELKRKAEDFLAHYSEGYFAPYALFQKGYAQFQLKEYQNAIDTFELFLKRYPFHFSAEGAQNWINQAKQEIQDSRNGNKSIKISRKLEIFIRTSCLFLATLSLSILFLPQLQSWKWLQNHPNKLGLQGAWIIFILGASWAILDPKRRSFAFTSVALAAVLVGIQIVGR